MQTQRQDKTRFNQSGQGGAQASSWTGKRMVKKQAMSTVTYKETLKGETREGGTSDQT